MKSVELSVVAGEGSVDISAVAAFVGSPVAVEAVMLDVIELARLSIYYLVVGR